MRKVRKRVFILEIFYKYQGHFINFKVNNTFLNNIISYFLLVYYSYFFLIFLLLLFFCIMCISISYQKIRKHEYYNKNYINIFYIYIFLYIYIYYIFCIQ